MLQLTTLVEIVKRLTAALRLVKLAEGVIPGLVAKGETSAESANAFLAQIPALRTDIEEQVRSALSAMEKIQDRIEALAQFLLLHRKALSNEQTAELDEQLAALRG